MFTELNIHLCYDSNQWTLVLIFKKCLILVYSVYLKLIFEKVNRVKNIWLFHREVKMVSKGDKLILFQILKIQIYVLILWQTRPRMKK